MRAGILGACLPARILTGATGDVLWASSEPQRLQNVASRSLFSTRVETGTWRGFEMFLSTDDVVALHSRVSELHRLGEPTALAEKFVARLQTQLAERQQHLDSLTSSAANENI